MHSEVGRYAVGRRVLAAVVLMRLRVCAMAAEPDQNPIAIRW